MGGLCVSSYGFFIFYCFFSHGMMVVSLLFILLLLMFDGLAFTRFQ
jgi:hypothetical protein